MGVLIFLVLLTSSCVPVQHPCPFFWQSGYQDLYWATGDAGPQTDPDNNGQNTDNLLGSIIRISVPSDGTGYLIPDGNLDSESLLLR